MTKTGKHPGGRPSEYTKAIGDKICSLLAQGVSLRTVCLADDMPDCSTVFRWLRQYEEFHKQYADAKQESADAMAEEILDLSDEAKTDAMTVDPKAAGAVVQAARLRVDTRKWLMSKMKPKKFGDKLDLTTDGKELPAPIYGGKSKNV